MPKYRVKSGVVRLKGKGTKEFPAVVNDVINLTVETATKFKEHLLPLGPDAYFIDEMDEYSEISSREMNMRMIPVEGNKGFFNVQNTITGNYVNSAPLSLKEATNLIKGSNIKPVFDEFEEKNITETIDEEEEEKVSKKKSSKKKEKSSKKEKTEKKSSTKKKKKSKKE